MASKTLSVTKKGSSELQGKLNQIPTKEELEQTVETYSACLGGLGPNPPVEAIIQILLNRSAAYRKLKCFKNVIEDCNIILQHEKHNEKALGSKVKALCSLGRFVEAYQVARKWYENDPENSLAKKEYDRLHIIIEALSGDEDESFTDGVDSIESVSQEKKQADILIGDRHDLGVPNASYINNQTLEENVTNFFSSSVSHLPLSINTYSGASHLSAFHCSNNNIKTNPCGTIGDPKRFQSEITRKANVSPIAPIGSTKSASTSIAYVEPQNNSHDAAVVSDQNPVIRTPLYLRSSINQMNTPPLISPQAVGKTTVTGSGSTTKITSSVQETKSLKSSVTSKSCSPIISRNRSSSLLVAPSSKGNPPSDDALPVSRNRSSSLTPGSSEKESNKDRNSKKKEASHDFETNEDKSAQAIVVGEDKYDYFTPDESSADFYCSYCCEYFVSSTELKAHCESDKHKNELVSDVGQNWKYRPPPRGLTASEYSKCHRFIATGSCWLGDNCSLAHSVEELQEWRKRFEYRCSRIQDAKDKNLQSNAYAENLLQKWMNAEKPESIMTDNLESVNVHTSCDLTVTMNTKIGSNAWVFTVTTKVSLNKVALLDEANRRLFHISLITIGPKKSQKFQKIDDSCQEWSNPSYTTARTMNEKVYRIKVIFKTDIYGTFRQSIIFDFGSLPVIVRQMCVESLHMDEVDAVTRDLMMSQSQRWDLPTMDVIPFEPKSNINQEEMAILEQYQPPIPSKFVMSTELQDDIQMSKKNYVSRMHSLLWIEEMAQFSSIAKYNVKASLQLVNRFLLMPSTASTAKFAQGGELFAHMRLTSDLSEDTIEGRLLLSNVHTVYIAPYNKKKKENEIPQQVYEAIVEEKGRNFIILRLSRRCVSELGLVYDTELQAQVQFYLNRLPLCEMHEAIDRLSNLDLVFPKLDDLEAIPWNPNISRKEKAHGRLNIKQKEAVSAITCDSNITLPPILIVGPYGTGKTYTLAQAALQILKQKSSRILICTHSNSAADLYIKDYLHPFVLEGNIDAKPLRIYYRHRWVQTIDPIVLEYCLTDVSSGAASFLRVPTKEEVMAHRIVVVTLSTSRYLYDLNLDPEFFTHIFLDEAAQALECESVMPLALAGKKTRIVLAGDHMQLSPEVHSAFARKHNFQKSFLERLYDLYPNDGACKILLCENYRSHRAIIDYTSELFYENKLLASGNQPAHKQFYPLSFFTARGEDIQHQNSTGYYNNAEVYEIVDRVVELSESWPSNWGKIEENGIGVVSPYYDQVIRIRSELRKKKMFNVSVERVLNVQGKQFRAIFLSTVRTRATCDSTTHEDELIDYGFISNVKLLNTAITRAQSLVSVVGDPVSLCSVGKCRKLWERFIELCDKSKSLHGITWNHLRAQLDGVELKKAYILNPLAPEFIPNRLRHAVYSPPPEVLSQGKYGIAFAKAQESLRPPHHLPTVGPHPSMAMMNTRVPIFHPRNIQRHQMMYYMPQPYAQSMTPGPPLIPHPSNVTNKSAPPLVRVQSTEQFDISGAVASAPKLGSSPQGAIIAGKTGMPLIANVDIARASPPSAHSSPKALRQGTGLLPNPLHHRPQLVGGYHSQVLMNASPYRYYSLGPHHVFPGRGYSMNMPMQPAAAQHHKAHLLGHQMMLAQNYPVSSHLHHLHERFVPHPPDPYSSMLYHSSSELSATNKPRHPHSHSSTPDHLTPQRHESPGVSPSSTPELSAINETGRHAEVTHVNSQNAKKEETSPIAKAESPTVPSEIKVFTESSAKSTEKGLTQNPYLQNELFNYILQTEGETMAKNFIEFLDQQKKESGKKDDVQSKTDLPKTGRITVEELFQSASNSDVKLQGARPKRHTVSVNQTYTKPESIQASGVGPSFAFAPAYTRTPSQYSVTQSEASCNMMETESFESDESLSDIPPAVNHMVRFLEDSLDDDDTKEIDSNLNRTAMPLYMRQSPQSANQPIVSYAGALPHPSEHNTIEKQTSVSSTNSDLPLPSVLLTPGDGGSNQFFDGAPEDPEADPLVLLKNLNIKASPGTQALYQYFS